MPRLHIPGIRSVRAGPAARITPDVAFKTFPREVTYRPTSLRSPPVSSSSRVPSYSAPTAASAARSVARPSSRSIDSSRAPSFSSAGSSFIRSAVRSALQSSAAPAPAPATRPTPSSRPAQTHVASTKPVSTACPSTPAARPASRPAPVVASPELPPPPCIVRRPVSEILASAPAPTFKIARPVSPELPSPPCIVRRHVRKPAPAPTPARVKKTVRFASHVEYFPAAAPAPAPALAPVQEVARPAARIPLRPCPEGYRVTRCGLIVRSAVSVNLPGPSNRLRKSSRAPAPVDGTTTGRSAKVRPEPAQSRCPRPCLKGVSGSRSQSVKKQVRFGDTTVDTVDKWIRPAVDIYHPAGPDNDKIRGWKVTPLPEPDQDGEEFRYTTYHGGTSSLINDHYDTDCGRHCLWAELASTEKRLREFAGIPLDNFFGPPAHMVWEQWNRERATLRESGCWAL